MSYPTVAGVAVEGLPMREAQSCLGPAIGAGATYQFFVSGTSTPVDVYQDGSLTTPFPIKGYVSADNFGRFPPIYLDNSQAYGVQFFDSTNTLQWTVDPYTPPLATVGTSSLELFGGLIIAPTGEVTIPAPSAGGSAISLTLSAGSLGSAALMISAPIPGAAAIIVNNSATTGIRTATFTATNKPGTATSSPAGWLPITCDGVQYYTPIWHGNNFTPYVANPSAIGETISGSGTVTFAGNGLTTITSGTAVPGSWYVPNSANIGSGYYIKFTKTSGLSGLAFCVATALTVAPSGATYTGGTLTTAWPGTTAGSYAVTLSTGQRITGCTLTNGSAVFTAPSTSIVGTPTTSLTVGTGLPINITNTGLAITNNDSSSAISGTYQLSTSLTGTPVVASGTITLSGGNGVQSPTYNGAANLVLASNGTATLNGASSSNWLLPTTASVGSNFWILITQTGGTSGYTFSAATGGFTAIGGGLTIGISGPGGSTFNVVGTYQISANSAGTVIVGSGSVTLTGGSNVQSANWSGTTPLVLASNGAATLNGGATSSWYSPNASNVGSGYWIKITRTSGTTGVNFSAAQGSWTNITNSGLSIGMTGYTGDVGTVTVGGTYQISSSSGGTPVLGSGTVSLSVNAGTVIHVYTTAVVSATETIPTGTTTVKCEIWGSGGGGGHTTGTGSLISFGFPGGCGGLAYSSYAASALGGVGKTLKYTVTNGGAGAPISGSSSAGSAGTIVAGTVTGFATMTGNGGGGGQNGNGSSGGTGGTATGGNVSNTTGTAGSTVGLSGHITGDLAPHGGGGSAGSTGSAGSSGAAVFFYS